MIKGINHIAISTGNIDALVKFYRDAFGFEFVEEKSWANSPRADAAIGLKGTAARKIALKGPNVFFDFYEYSAPQSSRADPTPMEANHPGYTHFALEVSDIDAEYDRLSKLGMAFNAPLPVLDDKPVRAMYGRDPDGNIIELIEIYVAGTKHGIEDLEGS